MSSEKQLEIQGLRAVAVVVVVLFHLWPAHISGGYVGVDVFFVISGFLITRIMLRELETTGKLNLGRFYSRRIRRLAPAATAVLVVVLIGYELYPTIYWQDLTDEAIASVLYYQNWHLAHQSVDYLAAGNAPGPLQHFWSLTVEEQYYLVWPIICLVAGLAMGALHTSARKLFSVLIVLIGISSLFYSWYLTGHSPGSAYFSTFTRAWELALGGGLAVFSRWNDYSHRVKRCCGLLGLGLISVSTLIYTKETRFPGVAALMPTVGAAFVIISGASDSKISAYSILKLRPLQYLGNMSYSLYLWHWPIIILYTTNGSTDINVTNGLIILFTAIAVSHFSKEILEDLFQGQGDAQHYIKHSILLAIALALVVVLLSKTTSNRIGDLVGDLTSSAEQPQARNSKILELKLLKVRDDKPEAYSSSCYANQKMSRPVLCAYGDQSSGKVMLLVGDSHAMQWTPALRVVAEKQGWKLVVMAKSACAFGGESVVKGGGRYESCDEWNSLAMESIKAVSPQIILFSQSKKYLAVDSTDQTDSVKTLAATLERRWKVLQSNGARVVAIRDTPWMGGDVPECLAKNLSSPAKCNKSKVDVVGNEAYDPIFVAANNTPGVDLLDFTSEFCGREDCYSMIAGDIVWRDGHHMTASFSRSLSKLFDEQLNLPQASKISSKAGDFLRDPVVDLAVKATKDAGSFSSCYRKNRDEKVARCDLSAKGNTVVAMLGDTRMAQWLPAISRLADNSVKLTFFGKRGCPVGLDINTPIVNGNSDCGLWYSRVQEELRVSKPDVVIVSQSLGYKLKGSKTWLENSERLAARLLHVEQFVDSLGGQLILIADTPRRNTNVPSCVLNNSNYYAVNCEEDLSDIIDTGRPDPVVLLAGQTPAIQLLDFTDLICRDELCSVTDGDVFIWRSKYLLTKTFVQSISDIVNQRLLVMMATSND